MIFFEQLEHKEVGNLDGVRDKGSVQHLVDERESLNSMGSAIQMNYHP